MNQLLTSMGWTLVHFLWQACGIALLYKWFDLTLGHERCQRRYLIGLLAQFSMLGASVLTFVYEKEWPILVQSSGIRSLSIAGTNEFASLHIYVSPLLPWIDAAWLLGVAFFGIRASGGWWVLRRWRSLNCQLVPEDVRDRFLRTVQRFHLKRTVDLQLLPGPFSPFAAGLLRSAVYLPISALVSLSPEQLDAIFAHELAHIRRADYFWNLLQTAVETIFFFHPAVWWLGKKIRHQRELCCDDIAVRFTVKPYVYASALLMLEEQRSERVPFAMALGGNENRSDLRCRITHILGHPGPTTKRGHRLSGLLAVAFMLVAILILGNGFPDQVAAGIGSDRRPGIPITQDTPPFLQTRSKTPQSNHQRRYERPASRVLHMSPATQPNAARGRETLVIFEASKPAQTLPTARKLPPAPLAELAPLAAPLPKAHPAQLAKVREPVPLSPQSY